MNERHSDPDPNIETINNAEKTLSSLLGGRPSWYAVHVTCQCASHCNAHTDRMLLRYGAIKNQAEACLHLEVVNESGETLRYVAIRDDRVPDAVRGAVVESIPLFLTIAQMISQRSEPTRQQLQQPQSPQQPNKPIRLANAIDQLSDALGRLLA